MSPGTLPPATHYGGVIPRALATLAIVGAGGVLAVRAWHGPFPWMNSPMNAASIAGAALLVALALGRQQTDGAGARRNVPALAVALLLTLLLFAVSLRNPFTSDDYVHVLDASRATPATLARLFVTPGEDFHFRPLVSWNYWLDWQWAGRNEWLWHASNLAIHLANVALVFLLARRLELSAWTAGFAAAVFGIHGSRPEVVAWVAARFDLLATLFVLAGLILLLDGRHVLAGVCCVAALTAKESAFVFPLLATLLVGWRRWRILAPYHVLTGAVFLYRFFLLGGIGGYRVPDSGVSAVTQFDLLRSLKGLLLRLPATLAFPINWSHPLEYWLVGAMALGAIAFAWLAWRGQGSAKAAAFLWIAALPAQHLLLIGADLEKSRVLYLPSAGFALLLAAAVPRDRRGLAAAAGCLVLFGACLQHNLVIWSHVSRGTRRVCDAMAVELRKDARPVAFSAPNVVDGVYAMERGMGECVELFHGIPAMQVNPPESKQWKGRQILRANEAFELWTSGWM